MAALIPGYVTEQKVVTTLNDDASINASITTEAANKWLVSQLVFTAGDMVILFTRTIVNTPGA